MAVKTATPQVDAVFADFCKTFAPLEAANTILLLEDRRTGARYCECHVMAEKLVPLTTTDTPLDLNEPQYRANREVVIDATAFAQMKTDALGGRSFSNIVAEYTRDYDTKHPLKIIGGQHRFEAIKAAHAAGMNVHHEIKVYFGLDQAQRLDVQVISNTNIAASRDLYDRMQETNRGPQLRNWCQSVGLLGAGQDFTDKRRRGGPISVQMARTFITNFFEGRKVGSAKFDAVKTTPLLSATGKPDDIWEALTGESPSLWDDSGLIEAAKQFAALVAAQRKSFAGERGPTDYPEKALNIAVLSAWAYVAGVLQDNPTRLARHYALAASTRHDPLRAEVLAGGKHKTDPDNYRGLGHRTDPQERGRMAEVFFLQSENARGITATNVSAGISLYHTKQSILESQQLKAKAADG